MKPRMLTVVLGLGFAGVLLAFPQHAVAGLAVVTASPKALDFAPNRAAQQIVGLSNAGRYPVDVHFDVTPPFAASAPDGTLSPGYSAPLGITLGAHDPQKPLQGKLRVLNAQGIVEVTVKLRYTPGNSRLPAYTVSPGSLEFGTVPSGSSADRDFTIVYNGTEDVGHPMITATTALPLSFGGNAGFSGTFSSRMVTGRITYDPEAPGENLNRPVEFKVDGEVVATLPVKGKAGPPAGPSSVSFNPSPLDFGSVSFPLVTNGTIATRDLTLTNGPDYTVSLQFELPSRPFALTGVPPEGVLVAPGVSLPLKIKLQAVDNHDLGEFNQTLVVNIRRYKSQGGRRIAAGREVARLPLHAVIVAPPPSAALQLIGDERGGEPCPVEGTAPPWLAFRRLTPTEFEVRHVAVVNQSHHLSYAVTWNALHAANFDIDTPVGNRLVVAPKTSVKLLDVKFTADASHETETEGVRAGVLEASGNAQFADLGTISLLGNVNSMSIGPGIVDFGSVPRNLTEPVFRTFTLYNHGPDPRSGVIGVGGHFQIQREGTYGYQTRPFTLAAGASETVNVGFFDPEGIPPIPLDGILEVDGGAGPDDQSGVVWASTTLHIHVLPPGRRLPYSGRSRRR